MSLYAIVHGQEPTGPALVAVLNKVAPFDPPRYRDAWVEQAGDAIAIRVHTRTGGGNRECWCDGDDHICYGEANDAMTLHPWYVMDEDDDFDATYADWYFRVDPAGVDNETMQALVALAQPPVDMGARWQAAIAALKGAT